MAVYRIFTVLQRNNNLNTKKDQYQNGLKLYSAYNTQRLNAIYLPFIRQ